MSTDYYTTIEREGCEECHRPGPWTDRLFVGSSSIGWRFCFKQHGRFEVWQAGDRIEVRPAR